MVFCIDEMRMWIVEILLHLRDGWTTLEYRYVGSSVHADSPRGPSEWLADRELTHSDELSH